MRSNLNLKLNSARTIIYWHYSTVLTTAAAGQRRRSTTVVPIRYANGPPGTATGSTSTSGSGSATVPVTPAPLLALLAPPAVASTIANNNLILTRSEQPDSERHWHAGDIAPVIVTQRRPATVPASRAGMPGRGPCRAWHWHDCMPVNLNFNLMPVLTQNHGHVRECQCQCIGSCESEPESQAATGGSATGSVAA